MAADGVQNSLTVEEFLDGIIADFEAYRTRVSQRVERACATSEDGVLVVGECVTRIVESAKKQVGELRHILDYVDSEADRPNITRMIEDQAQMMGDFVDEMSSGLRVQTQSADQALAQTQHILNAGAKIAELASESRTLAFNAQIEASRVGAQSSVFMVIAREMKELSVGIEAANESVADLANGLAETIPSIASSSTQLFEHAAAFSDDFKSKLTQVEHASQELNDVVRATLNDSERRAEEILEGSQHALSELGFQDPMAQSLRKIDRMLVEFHDRLQTQADAVDRAGDLSAIEVEEEEAEVVDTGGQDELQEGEFTFF